MTTNQGNGILDDSVLCRRACNSPDLLIVNELSQLGKLLFGQSVLNNWS